MFRPFRITHNIFVDLVFGKRTIMKKLQEIIRIIGRKRIKRVEIFNESGNLDRNNLYYRMYRGIREGKYRTDEEAAEDLFGVDPSDKRYQMLKSRVNKRLLNNLLFLHNPTSNYEQAIYFTNRNLVAAKFLMINGGRASSGSLLKSTLNKARQYSLTEVEMECLRILRSQASFLGEVSEYEKYNERFLYIQKVLDAECYAEECYQKLIIHFAQSSASKPELTDEAKGYVQNISKLLDHYHSHSLMLHYFRVRVVAAGIYMDYGQVYDACQEAEEYLKSRPQLSQNARLGEFALHRMIAAMHLGDYKLGKANAEKCLAYFKHGSNNWIIFLEYYFLLCMHTGNYSKALEIYRDVTSHPRFDTLERNRLEKWKIFEGFLRYMARDLQFPDAEDDTFSSRFNIFKFLNEVPIYSRDKRGLNIAILILQVLFLLDRRDFDGIMSRTEALKVYCSRYLKRDENYRSNCFLKMVITMEKKDFDWEETKKISTKYLKKLQSARFSYDGNLANLEIIPYEQLWTSIMQKLK